MKKLNKPQKCIATELYECYGIEPVAPTSPTNPGYNDGSGNNGVRQFGA